MDTVSFDGRGKAEGQIKSGASWFFWIAGLSLINSAVSLSGSDWGFIIGLGITQIIDAVANEFGSLAKAIALIFDFMAAGVFIAFGIFARQRQAWAFITGMVFYSLDGLLFLLGMDLLSIGFHAFALYCIFAGLKAHLNLRELEREQETSGAAVAVS